MAAIAVSAVIASACSPADAPRIKAEIVAPVLPAAARVPCAGPVALPDRDMTQGEVTAAWGRDRASLRACETKRIAVVAAVDSIGGKKGIIYLTTR